jgi:transposase
VVDTLQIEASLNGYCRLRWAAGFGQRRWVVENACGLGQHLAQCLLARGEVVEDAAVTGNDAYELQRRLGRQSQRCINRYANPPVDIAASYVYVEGR